MADLFEEVRGVVMCLLESLRPVAEKHPKELTSTEEFNHVLGLAKQALPRSPTIQDMKLFARHASALDVLTRSSALHGALTASRSAKASVRAPESITAT